MSAPERVVICTAGGLRQGRSLPASESTGRVSVGGDRTMAELAIAIASLGIDTEIRGAIDRALVERLAAIAGAPVPAMDLPPRPARPGDLVVVPDAWDDPASFVHLSLSPARTAIMLMAPPGMHGWPFSATWERPDPLTIPRTEVGRSEHYLAMRGMGFELWTGSPAVRSGLEGSGARFRWVGCGRPEPFPDPPAKTTDIVFARNRWAPWAREALVRSTASHHELGEMDHHSYLRRLGEARLFLLPMWMTGIARVFHEARAMGTPVVTLRIDRFPDLYDHMAGVVVADRVEDLPATIDGLLSDPGRLASLSEAGMEEARADLAWDPYVERIGTAVREPLPDPGAAARAGFGAALGGRLDAIAADAAAEVAALDAATEAYARRRSVRLATGMARVLGRGRR